MDGRHAEKKTDEHSEGAVAANPKLKLEDISSISMIKTHQDTEHVQQTVINQGHWERPRGRVDTWEKPQLYVPLWCAATRVHFNTFSFSDSV